MMTRQMLIRLSVLGGYGLLLFSHILIAVSFELLGWWSIPLSIVVSWIVARLLLRRLDKASMAGWPQYFEVQFHDNVSEKQAPSEELRP